MSKKIPQRHAFCSRHMAWAYGTRFFKWGFFVDRRGVCFNIGEREPVTEVPQSKFLVNLTWLPLMFSVFWYGKHIIWLGDREWKKGL